MNTSALCVIMRLAKSKDGGKSFRTKLQNAGLSVQSGRRKSVPATIFSILCEGYIIFIFISNLKMHLRRKNSFTKKENSLLENNNNFKTLFVFIVIFYNLTANTVKVDRTPNKVQFTQVEWYECETLGNI